MALDYPETAATRGRWIAQRRPSRNRVDPWKPHAFLAEEERTESGKIDCIATIFLTNRECPWRCLMCDLWKNTLPQTAPHGAIPAQIRFALDRIRSELSPAINQVKLYNSGSFFDPRAIPPSDFDAIAQTIWAFKRVIVECHPALVDRRAVQFQELLHRTAAKFTSNPTESPRLEVAMGLETVHPRVLQALNKQMTLGDFSNAAGFLKMNDLALRVFILIRPPFLAEDESLEWTQRSIDFAFECGATVASLIPTRPGNGALDALAERGEFTPPKLAAIESALAYGIGLKRGRVFADLWDLTRFSECPDCLSARTDRLRSMNLRQVIFPAIRCHSCRNGYAS